MFGFLFAIADTLVHATDVLQGCYFWWYSHILFDQLYLCLIFVNKNHTLFAPDVSKPDPHQWTGFDSTAWLHRFWKMSESVACEGQRG